jgi:hypothetical protein
MRKYRFVCLMLWLLVAAIQICAAGYSFRAIVKCPFTAERGGSLGRPFSPHGGIPLEKPAQAFGFQAATLRGNAGVQQSAKWILKQDYRGDDPGGHRLLSQRVGGSDYRGYLSSASRFRAAFDQSDVGTGAGSERLPAWQQAGIYGLEFLAGSVGAGLSTYIGGGIAVSSLDPYNDLPTAAAFYTAGNVLLTSTCTYWTARLLGQRVSWWQAAVGAGIGSLVGASSTYLMIVNGCNSRFYVPAMLLPPILGATIGLNIK